MRLRIGFLLRLAAENPVGEYTCVVDLPAGRASLTGNILGKLRSGIAMGMLEEVDLVAEITMATSFVVMVWTPRFVSDHCVDR